MRVRSQLALDNARFMTCIEPEETNIHKEKSNLGPLLDKFSHFKEKKVYDNHSSSNKESGIVIGSENKLNKRGFRETKNTIYQPFHTIDKPKGMRISSKKVDLSEVRKEMG